MSVLVWCAAAAGVLSVLTLLQTLRNLRRFAPPPPVDDTDRTLVSVCIPCRDEEENVEACVRAALCTSHPAVEVVVYDDESTDATAEIVRRLAEEDARVRLAPTSALPAGWCGKQHANQQMSLAAGGEWLLFTDADVRLEPDAVGRGLAFARRSNAWLVSTFPRQIVGSLGELLVVPMMFFLLIGYLPFGRMRRSLSASASAGCGQFILVERGAYESVGGHGSVRDSMHDGIKLPRAFRRAGHKSDLFDGTSLASVRMYRGFGQTWRGFVKNAYEGLGSVPLLVFLSALHLFAHVAPWAALPLAILFDAPEPVTAWLGVAVGAQIVQRALLCRRFEHPIAAAALHPVAVALLTAIQWSSFVVSLSASRTWKGRTLGSDAGERVVLVDESDTEIGSEEKLAAHRDGGALHRAFSVFVFDDDGRLLLQRRASGKYHFGGLWTNTCCGHPRPSEAPIDAARRRLREEMGIDASLEFRGKFLYEASDPGSGLTEREFDHVFAGQFNGDPEPDPSEADDWRWVDPAELERSLDSDRERFTPWFPLAYRALRGG